MADAAVRSSAGAWSISTSPLGGARFEMTWRRAHGADTVLTVG
ncbi:MAG: hypothetical protein ACLQPH_15865 [Acidimicrobiales bacterium]